MQVIITGIERRGQGWLGMGYIERPEFHADVVICLKDDQEWSEVINSWSQGLAPTLKRDVQWQEVISAQFKPKA